MNKKILMIGTGGTIASVPTENGFRPEMEENALFERVPELSTICDADFMQVLNLDSTNIRPEHWLVLAETIYRNYDAYDGFVITHGTDTMAYTAAGLSYFIQNSPKPIVLTGAQKPLSVENSDAGRNLIDAFRYACDDESMGVQIVFFGAVITGTRARKNYAKSFMAFGSINYPEIARIEDGLIIRYIPQVRCGGPVFYLRANTNVGLVKLVPGMQNDVMRFLLSKYDGLVIESFGVGGLPEYSDFYEQIRAAIDKGKTIVMTTQVPNEGSDISVYQVGNVLKKNSRVLEAYDMTSEATFAKLMWILGQTQSYPEIVKLFYTPVGNDILKYAEHR